jgi:hypothetical protein
MLSTGEWIRNRRINRLRNELAASFPSLPVFTQRGAPIQGNLNVGSVRSIRQTGSSKFRNLASVYTDIVGLRTGDQLSQAETLARTPRVIATRICNCVPSNAKKVGLCPTCR